MSHRAEQILEAVKAAIEAAAPSTVRVYTNRRDSLSEDQDELPAITVDYGEDTPFAGDGSAMLDGKIESLLTVNVTGIAIAAEEAELRQLLLALRTHAHIGIRRTPDLALPFVSATHYGGANPPEIDVSGETLVGELTCPWGVLYEMNLNTPE